MLRDDFLRMAQVYDAQHNNCREPIMVPQGAFKRLLAHGYINEGGYLTDKANDEISAYLDRLFSSAEPDHAQ